MVICLSVQPHPSEQNACGSSFQKSLYTFVLPSGCNNGYPWTVTFFFFYFSKYKFWFMILNAFLWHMAIRCSLGDWCWKAHHCMLNARVFFGQCVLYKPDTLALYIWSNFKFSSCINFCSFMCSILDTSQSQWPCSLRCVFMAAHLLGLWVRILLGYGCLSFVGVVCGLAEFSATGWSLIQRNPTECGVCECDHEASTVTWPWPTRGCHAMGKKTLDTNSPCRAAVLWIPFCNLGIVNH